MNIKKIGLTALAASLVSVSANAGSMSVSGGASMNVTGHTGEGRDVGTSFTMGNQLTFTGSGELDNGLNVSLSFVLDQADAAPAPFDSHSVTVSSDAMGSLTLAGEGGTTATGAINKTAAGNLWDAFDGLGTLNLVDFGTDLLTTISAGDNGLMYTSPELTEGLTLVGSYVPQGGNKNATTGYGVNYSGFDGLTINYATQDIIEARTAASTTGGDQDVMKVSYVYGSFTGTYSNSDYNAGTAAASSEASSYAVSYSVSDELSITYGSETFESGTAGDQDAEITGLSFAYTAGGMTLSGSMKDGENLVYGTGTVEDREQWTLGASFAF
jgi:outer membrane protein OmpU